MEIANKIVKKKGKIAIIGLGYVGMPLAIAFAKKINVIGFDLNKKKIAQYQHGIDPTNEVGDDAIKKSTIEFTSDEKKLREASFIIVAVPTPINLDKTPDLFPVESASRIVGRNLRKDSIVVYESTVYPGVTEDICIPILEKESDMKCGKEFHVGYSPERINPGDEVHTLKNIVKIISSVGTESLNDIEKIYKLVIEAGVHKVSCIKVAEAAKVVENSQRDINIAFMNEIAIVFDKMQIDTHEVLTAMNTKWNSLGFFPGLVGGHCIGVDPYYFIYQAERLGYHSQIVLSGRKINDGMSDYIVNKIIKMMILANKKIKESKIAILGLTFKEDTPDIRNSKIIEIIEKLEVYGVRIQIADPVININELNESLKSKIVDFSAINNIDCLIVAVSHKDFKTLNFDKIESMFLKCDNKEKVIIDIRSILDKTVFRNKGYSYWNL